MEGLRRHRSSAVSRSALELFADALDHAQHDDRATGDADLANSGDRTSRHLSIHDADRLAEAGRISESSDK